MRARNHTVIKYVLYGGGSGVPVLEVTDPGRDPGDGGYIEFVLKDGNGQNSEEFALNQSQILDLIVILKQVIK
jgi:hypothetical protein